MTNIEESFQKTKGSIKEFTTCYLEYLTHLLKEIDLGVVENIVNSFVNAGEQGNTIYFVGNGGSAATASHFASDLSINTKAEGHRLIKAVSLVDSISTTTAIANDEGYENIFEKQLEVLMTSDDVLVALSVSGNSPNIIKAVNYARKKGAITIGCTGFDGGELRTIVDINLHVPTLPGEYGPVEDIFQILDHLIYSYLRLKRLGRLPH